MIDYLLSAGHCVLSASVRACVRLWTRAPRVCVCVCVCVCVWRSESETGATEQQFLVIFFFIFVSHLSLGSHTIYEIGPMKLVCRKNQTWVAYKLEGGSWRWRHKAGHKILFIIRYSIAAIGDCFILDRCSDFVGFYCLVRCNEPPAPSLPNCALLRLAAGQGRRWQRCQRWRAPLCPAALSFDLIWGFWHR